MLISYPCPTFIYYYPYLSVVEFFNFIYNNFIRSSVNVFRVRKDFAANLNLETPFYIEEYYLLGYNAV
jgi:hypothetical protein